MNIQFRTFAAGLSVAAALAAPSSAVAEILVDDFTTGAGFTAQAIDFGGIYRSSEDGLDPAHTIGGHRFFFVQSCLSPAVGTLPVEHDPSSGTIAVGGTEVSQWCEGVGLSYGSDYGAGGPELDLDLLSAGVTHLEIDLLTFDRGDPDGPFSRFPAGTLAMSTRYTDTGTGSERFASTFVDFEVAETDGPATVRVALDEMLLTAEGEYDPANIDGIYLYLGGANAGAELIVSEIRLVAGNAALVGDYNGDGFVSQADLDLVLLNWGDDTLPPGWTATDQFDGGLISQNELDGVLLNWGDGSPPTSGNVAAVPEPAVGGVVAAGVVLARRRRGQA